MKHCPTFGKGPIIVITNDDDNGLQHMVGHFTNWLVGPPFDQPVGVPHLLLVVV